MRALECLLAVADLRSVTRAAQYLHLSQPAISHQLAVLEREAGTALLIRERRGVRLTPAGRAALPEARRAVAAADDAVRLARGVGQGVGGTIRVVCAQSLTVALLAPVLARWNLDRPDVKVALRESTDPETAFAMLDSGETDLLLFPDLLFDDAAFQTTILAEEEGRRRSPVPAPAGLPGGHPAARSPGAAVRPLHGREPARHLDREPPDRPRPAGISRDAHRRDQPRAPARGGGAGRDGCPGQRHRGRLLRGGPAPRTSLDATPRRDHRDPCATHSPHNSSATSTPPGRCPPTSPGS